MLQGKEVHHRQKLFENSQCRQITPFIVTSAQISVCHVRCLAKAFASSSLDENRIKNCFYCDNEQTSTGRKCFESPAIS